MTTGFSPSLQRNTLAFNTFPGTRLPQEGQTGSEEGRGGGVMRVDDAGAGEGLAGLMPT